MQLQLVPIDVKRPALSTKYSENVADDVACEYRSGELKNSNSVSDHVAGCRILRKLAVLPDIYADYPTWAIMITVLCAFPVGLQVLASIW